MYQKIFSWLPFGITITALCGLIYLTAQQSYRSAANDPQIQMAQEISMMLANGQDPKSIVYTNNVDISKILSPFLVIYNDKGQPIISSALLDNKMPQVPQGVLNYVKQHGEDRVTWQPKNGARFAIVATKYTNNTQTGFVVAGRSLEETEKREDRLLMQVAAGWIVILIASFLALNIAPIVQKSTSKTKRLVH